MIGHFIAACMIGSASWIDRKDDRLVILVTFFVVKAQVTDSSSFLILVVLVMIIDDKFRPFKALGQAGGHGRTNEGSDDSNGFHHIF